MSAGPGVILLETPVLSVTQRHRPRPFLDHSSVPVPRAPAHPQQPVKESNICPWWRGARASQSRQVAGSPPAHSPVPEHPRVTHPQVPGEPALRRPGSQTTSCFPSLHKPWTQSTLPQLRSSVVTASWHQLSPPSICHESVQTNCENQRGSSNAVWTPPLPLRRSLIKVLVDYY